MSHLAYMSNRSFVFEDCVLSCAPFSYAICDFALRPTQRVHIRAHSQRPHLSPVSLPLSSSQPTAVRAVNAE